MKRAAFFLALNTLEGFNVTVAEAMAAGCVPVLPDRLSYPEVVPERYHPSALYADGRFRVRLAEVVSDLGRARRAADGLAGAMARYAWPRVAAELDGVLERTVLSSR